MNRFNSNEDLAYHGPSYQAGMAARSDRKTLGDNPNALTTNWFYKSWAAGWVDKDMEIGVSNG